MTSDSMTAQSILANARAVLATQGPSAAMPFFETAARAAPSSAAPLLGLGFCLMALSRPTDAVAVLERAAQLPGAPPLARRNLGIALIAQGRLDEAIATLRAVAEVDPEAEICQLHLGHALALAGHAREAARTSLLALACAQGKGLWRDEASTPAALRTLVVRAMDRVDRAQSDTLLPLLDRVARRHHPGALDRVEHWLAEFLARRKPASTDPEQHARFLYFPGISTHVFHPRASFPWIEALEAGFDAMREEAIERCLMAREHVSPFLSLGEGDRKQDYLGGADPAWDACFFYRDGQRVDASHLACPNTTSTLGSLPLVRIRDHAPEICFSILGPGTHILPHTGVTNTRLVVHLPLKVPRDCAIRVRGQVHAWREGEAVVFDDTYVHEAWNRSDAPRIVLLMDTWNPNLTLAEREGIAAIVEGIGDFNRG